MKDFTVVYTFNSGSGDIVLPLVFQINDPKEGIKGTLIEGTRGDGSIFIPGGKKSQIITVKGYLVNHNGYEALISAKATFQSAITTNVAVLTCKHYTGIAWTIDYSYIVRRISEIVFNPDSLRTDYIEYTIELLVLNY